MWRLLAKLGLEPGQLRGAERSYSALGDVARARFLTDTIAIADDASKKLVRQFLIFLDNFSTYPIRTDQIRTRSLKV